VKITEPAPRKLSEYEIKHRAWHLWAKSTPDKGWAAKTEKEMDDNDMAPNHRIAVLNRLIAAEWDKLEESERAPWIKMAKQQLLEGPSME